jgi:hypothetical protein
MKPQGVRGLEAAKTKTRRPLPQQLPPTNLTPIHPVDRDITCCDNLQLYPHHPPIALLSATRCVSADLSPKTALWAASSPNQCRQGAECRREMHRKLAGENCCNQRLSHQFPRTACSILNSPRKYSEMHAFPRFVNPSYTHCAIA